MSLEPRVQMAAGVAELAELVVRLGGQVPVVLRLGRELRRIGAGLPAAAGQQRSTRLPPEPLGLVLQLAGELRMTLAIIGQADRQARGLLVQRAGDPAAIGRDRAKLLLIELAELQFRLIPRLEQPAAVVRADR